MRKQSLALGGFQESTRGRLGCHPQFFATRSFSCDDESVCDGSHHRATTKEIRALPQNSVRPRSLRSRRCSLRKHNAAGRNVGSRCAVSLSHHDTGTSAGDVDPASRFASWVFAAIRSSAWDTHTSDSTGHDRPSTVPPCHSPWLQRNSAATPLSPTAHGTPRCNACDADRNSRRTDESSCSLSEEYANTIAARTQRQGCESESSLYCRRSCHRLLPETSRSHLRLTPDVDPKWGHPSDTEPNTSPPVPADSSRLAAVRCTPPTFALPSARASLQTPLWIEETTTHLSVSACHSYETASAPR